MKILITGGAGFIGSHLAERLLDEGHEISIIDDLSTGRLSNISEININVYCWFSSILNEEIMERVISETDQIYHLAAVVGVKKVMDEPIQTLQINTKGTEIILKLASKYNKKILIASTSEVYGKNHSFSEDSDRILGSVKKRRWAYACSKTLDEFLALAYYDEKKLPVVIARLFNTVGPRQLSNYGMVVPNFIEQALSNQPIVIHGDGMQTRSFCHVKDTIEILIKLMNEPKAEGEIVNVGNDFEVSINELAFIIRNTTGSNSEIKHIPYEQVYNKGFEDMQNRRPDLSKMISLTGYIPKYDLKDIIKDIILEKIQCGVK